jgi:DNA-binding transcriptional regulator PaaX
MLQREHGASLDELVAAMGWLPHTTRAALTGLRKKGYLIASEKVEDVRRYRIAGEAA